MLMSQLGLFTNSVVFCNHCLFECIKLMLLSDVVLIIMLILSWKSSCELIVDCIPFHQEEFFFIIHHSDFWCQMLTHYRENIWSELSAFYLDSSGFWFSTMCNTRTVFIYRALWYCVILIVLYNNVATSAPNFMHHAFWFLLCITDVEPKFSITH